MEVIDPESSGLTNEVSGRLSFFTRDDRASKDDSCASALPTPNKEAPADNFVAVETELESEPVVLGAEDGAASQLDKERDLFLASLQGLARQEVRNKIGEHLYQVIAVTHPNLAGKLTGMFLEATENVEDLSELLFSPASLHYHLQQAVAVLESVVAAASAEPSPANESSNAEPAGAAPASASKDTTPMVEEVTSNKRLHARESGGPRQYPYNGKKARTERGDSGRPWFAEIVDDSGKRTKVPCKYDAEKRMYVPTGGRDVVPGGKVGTRDKTAEDLQALDTGEADEAKLRARQKQLDIGKNTQGYKKLMLQKLRGRQLQDIIKLPYITEEGVLELTLKCSKKRYDGYLRMWKRKLYEYAGLQRLDFKGFPPLPDGQQASSTSTSTSADTPATPLASDAVPSAAPKPATTRPNSRKQSNPSRLPLAAAPPPPQGSWAKKLHT